MIAVRPRKKKVKQESRRDKEEKDHLFLRNLLFEAMDRLGKDESELAKKLRGELIDRIKDW
jgi:hypothetical protein